MARRFWQTRPRERCPPTKTRSTLSCPNLPFVSHPAPPRPFDHRCDSNAAEKRTALLGRAHAPPLGVVGGFWCDGFQFRFRSNLVCSHLPSVLQVCCKSCTRYLSANRFCFYLCMIALGHQVYSCTDVLLSQAFSSQVLTPSVLCHRGVGLCACVVCEGASVRACRWVSVRFCVRRV